MYHLIDYVWCVEKFTQYIDKVNNNSVNNSSQEQVYPLLTSPVFAYKNTRWVLNLYPEGLGDQSSQGYISLFIKYISEDPESLNAKVELSLLNNKNERVYCRDTGDHQYQTFIDFGYKQFLKTQDIKDQKDDLLSNGMLKIFTRVEFENSSTLPTSLTWANYDLLLFKENFNDLYESKNLYDIIIKVYKKPQICSQFLLNTYPKIKKFKSESLDLTCGCNCCTSFYTDYEETIEIKAHKFILASRSGKFRDLLKTNLVKSIPSSMPTSSTHPGSSTTPTTSSTCNCSKCTDSQNCQDFLFIETDRSPKIIEYLIKYMYTGYLESLDSYAKDIYEVSKEYKVHGLTNLAREYITKEINIQNCCDYLIFCVVNNDYELNSKVYGFIQENYDKVVRTNSYKQARRKYRELFENTFSEISKKIMPNSNQNCMSLINCSVPSVSCSSSSSSSSSSNSANKTTL
ncbi:unnamed protein product [Brachionus calyciflorus]|uniref:Uncharacterized protein n=1 Tax=Brachionus calyciflorus TaxID=104777 RepID=A0A814D3U0_9BILA|nr:unnamed protein product [Brachionus calyciflorus]